MNNQTVVIIDEEMLDATTQAARESPRGRKNRNFHPDDNFPSHRLLNAIEPGSYVAPHRHLDPGKDETMLVLRGRMGLVIFEDDGTVRQAVCLAAGSRKMGVDIPHGCWHTVLGLVSGTVFLEAKAGPYVALNEAERASWAPLEGDAAVKNYLAELETLFSQPDRG